MARNREKYLYLELAILRDSLLFQALLADAAASGKPLAQVAVQRLADYYRTSSRPDPAQIIQPPRRTGSLIAKEAPSLVSPAHEEKEPEYLIEQARANAAAALAALDAWEPI